MAPECGAGAGGCSRPGCAGVRLMPGENALLSAEAELLQQHQQQQASQKPYRVGLILLCVGALFNWLGLAQAYVEPMRYIGVGCIVAGALLICAAMCRWLGRSGAAAAAATAARPDDNLRNNGSDELSGVSRDESGHGPVPSVHVISLPRTTGTSSDGLFNKPPDYESLVTAPPSYEDAIKLRPSLNVVDERQPPSPSSTTCSATRSTSDITTDLATCPQYDDVAKNTQNGTENVNASPNDSPARRER